MSRSSDSSARFLILLCGAAAAAILMIDIAVPTSWWASFFHHPARQPMPEVTMQGALLWRIALAALGIMVLGFPMTFRWADRGWNRSPSPVRPAPAPLDRRTWLWLGAVVVCGLALRATRLGESLWYDEIASWLSYGAGVTTPGPIIGNYFDPVNHVLHTLLSWCSVNVIGNHVGDELSLRLPALLFSLASIAAMFALGREAGHDRTAWLAAALAAVVPVSVLEGAEARGYSMMIFFAASATMLLTRLLRRPSLGLAALYTVCCALGVWAQFVTAFVPIGHGVWLAWRAVRAREWPQLRLGAVCLLAAAALSVVLYSPMIPDMLQAKRMFFTSRGDEPTIFGAEGRHALMQLGGSWQWWAAAPGLALAAVGLASLRRGETQARAVVALSLFGLPVMIAIVVISGSWIYSRFTFFALPGGLLLMALGIDQLWRRSRGLGAGAVLVMAMMSFADLATRPPKQPLRDAAEYVRAHGGQGARVLAIGLAHEVLRAYGRDLQISYSLFSGRDLPRDLAAAPSDWVVVEYPGALHAETWRRLNDAGFQTAATFNGWVDWTNGDVIVLRRVAGS